MGEASERTLRRGGWTLAAGLAAAVLGACAPIGLHGGPAFDPGPGVVVGAGWVAHALPLTPGGMNDAGTISGQSGGTPLALSNGTLTALGVLPASNGCTAYRSPVIAATGASIASSCNEKFGVWWFFWQKPPNFLSQASPIPAAVDVQGLNLGIRVVGTAFFPPAARRAFRYEPGGNLQVIHPEILVIPPSRVERPTDSEASGINDAGFVAGSAFAGATSIPLLWPPGAGGPRVLPAAAQPAGATAIRAGVVAGFSGQNAVTWTLAGVQASSLPVPGLTRVTALSSQGRLAGTALFTDAQGVQRSRAWTSIHGSAPVFLEAPGGDSWLPVGIDTCGNIAAQVLDGAGRAKGGVLLTRSSFFLSCDTPPVATQ